MTDIGLRGRELAEAVIERIKANPSAWSQEVYVNECGTTFCFAGHAGLMAGGVWNQQEYSFKVDDKHQSFSEYASKVLELDEDIAERNIFYCFTTDPNELEVQVKQAYADQDMRSE
jgi:uncharacterized protein CbrC (UPF0167 family)